MPKAGGSYYFISRSMGPMLGTIVGLGSWLGLVFKGAFALEGFGEYVVTLTPIPVVTAGVGLGVVVVGANLLGGKVSGGLQNAIVVFLLLILGFFVTRGMVEFRVQTFRPFLPHGWSGVFSTTGLVFISYLGVVKASAVAEEVRDPGRTFPRAVLSAVAVVTLLYVLVMTVVTGVIPQGQFAGLNAPLVEAAQIFAGTLGGIALAVAGLLATASTGNAAVISSSRYPFAMARDGLMAEWFNRIHRRFRTPFRSILVTGVMMIALLILFEVETLAKMGSVFNILVFAMLNLAVVLLRRIQPEWYRPAFKAPGYPWLQVGGTIVTLALIFEMGLGPQVAAGAFLFVGYGWFWLHRHLRGEEAVEPGYDLRDHMQRVRQVQAIDVKREAATVEEEEIAEEGAIVVELTPDQPSKHLLTVAASLARRKNARIEAVVFTEVPFQSPLYSVQGPGERFYEKAVAAVEDLGCSIDFHHVVGRDRARAILDHVGENTNIVLLDWRARLRMGRLRESYVDEILEESPTRVGVLKYRGIQAYERIPPGVRTGPPRCRSPTPSPRPRTRA